MPKHADELMPKHADELMPKHADELVPKHADELVPKHAGLEASDDIEEPPPDAAYLFDHWGAGGNSGVSGQRCLPQPQVLYVLCKYIMSIMSVTPATPATQPGCMVKCAAQVCHWCATRVPFVCQLQRVSNRIRKMRCMHRSPGPMLHARAGQHAEGLSVSRYLGICRCFLIHGGP